MLRGLPIPRRARRGLATALCAAALAPGAPAQPTGELIGPLLDTVPTGDPLPSRGRLGGVAVDRFERVYVADFGARVWRVGLDGSVRVFADDLRGSSGNAIDRDGSLLQASFADDRIVRIAPDGAVSTFADEGLDGPVGIAVDRDGVVWVCNRRGDSITRIAPGAAPEVFASGPPLAHPNGIAVGPDGALYVTGSEDGDVVRVGRDGRAERFATVPRDGCAHIAPAPHGFLVTVIRSHEVFHVSPGGEVALLAGTGEPGFADGQARRATLAHPNGIAATADGLAFYLGTLRGAWRGGEPTEIVLRRLTLPGGGPGPRLPWIERRRIAVGELRFDALTCGPKDGELVLLLHGFPQTAFSFRDQLLTLALAGYHAVAPDQRGYSPGARPREVSAYAMGELVGDVVGLADALGREHFHLVGHDWGGAVAWVTATRHPARVRSLTVLSTPHFAAFGRALGDGSSEQARRSAYFEVFGAEGAETRFLADDARYLRGVFAGSGLDPAAIQTYVDALRDPDAMRAALSWYRQLLRGRGPAAASSQPAPAPPPIRAPTLYVWGTEDRAFARGPAEATAEFVAGPYRFEVLEGAGHWLPEAAAQRVSELLVAHLLAADGR